MKRIALAAACVLMLGAIEAHACNGHLQSARLAIGGYVERLGELELKVLHRLMGGREPSFDYLAREARAIVAVLYTRKAAIIERRMRRCRNWVPPVRRTCRDAAARLVDIIEQSADENFSDATRLDYAKLIARCETWLAIPHRSSFLRMP